MAPQTQTTSQHYRPTRFHECLDRETKTTTLKLFYVSSKMAEHCREKKSPHVLFFKDHPFYFLVTEAALLFSFLKSLLWPLVSSLLSVSHD